MRDVLPVAIAAQLLGNACLLIQPILVGVYVDRLHLSLSAAGYVSAAELTGLAITAVVIARLAARGQLGHIGIVACALSALANVFSIFVESTPTLVIARLLAGCAAGAALAVGSAYAAGTRVPDRVFALAFATITLYGLVFFSNAAALLEQFGAAGVYTVKAVLGVLAGVVIALRTRRFPPEGRQSRGPAAAGNHRSSAGISPHLGVLISGFLLYLGHGAVWTYEERMGVHAGLSGAQIGHAFALASVAGFVGALIAAAVGLRIGRALPQFIALSLSIVAALLIIVSDSQWSFTVAACLIAGTWFYGVPYLAGLAAALDPAGRLAGTLSAVMNVGFALGPYIAASIVASSFAPVGWLAAAAYAVSLALVVAPSRRLARQARKAAVSGGAVRSCAP